MPNTAHGLPYPDPTAPVSAGANDIRGLADALEARLFNTVATPPASPTDGQLWTVSVAAGVEWMFRYNAGSASPYKWEFVGGAPLCSQVDGSVSTASLSYVVIDGTTPSITIPFGGDYDLSYGCEAWNSAAGYSAVTWADNSTWLRMAGTNPVTLARTYRAPARPTGSLVRLQYAVASGTGTFQSRWLQVRPVRVGPGAKQTRPDEPDEITPLG